MIEKWLSNSAVPTALVREPTAQSSQKTPVRSACLRVNDGSSRVLVATGGSPASVRQPELFRSVAEQRCGRDRQNSQGNEKGAVRRKPPRQPYSEIKKIDQLREDHGARRKAEAGGGRRDPRDDARTID